MINNSSNKSSSLVLPNLFKLHSLEVLLLPKINKQLLSQLDYSDNRTHNHLLLKTKEVSSDNQLDNQIKHWHPKLEVLDFSHKHFNNNSKISRKHLTCLVVNQPSNLPVLFLDNNQLKPRLKHQPQPRYWEVGLNQLKLQMSLNGKWSNLLPLKYRQWIRRTKKKFVSLLNVIKASWIVSQITIALEECC